jgi:hypothetical protein
MIVTMTMPIVLTREMGPNARLHHQAKAKVTARLREDARRAATNWVNDPKASSRFAEYTSEAFWAGGHLVMDVEVEWPPRRKRWDEDNIVAALKPVRDGIADALWGGEDKHVRVGTVSQTSGSGGLRITFRTGPDAE